MPLNTSLSTSALPKTEYNMFDAACSSRRAISRIANKWTMLLLMALAEQPYHFGELHRKVECISRKMLTQTLKGLQQDGLVCRNTLYKGNVLKSSYQLTPLGESLIGPILQLQAWAIENGSKIG
jgi:DNA-binding HxlR family transcriptional regulator